MTVSFIIVAYNEQATIEAILEDIRKQDYPHKKIEILLIDSNSSDMTKSRMYKFADRNRDFKRVLVLDNPGRTLPCGWNVALKEASGDVILRVDAHASIPLDFISNNVCCLEAGEMICGGYRPNIIDEETPWKKTLLLAESSMFGSSIAPYRRNNRRKYVKSVFHGAYRKEVFAKVGQYNEELSRTEDNEMHYRMRKAGYKICFDPSIVSYQHTRNTLGKMVRQKYWNGYWIGQTAKVCPECLSFYHFIPGVFVAGIFITILGGIDHNWWPGVIMWGCYWWLAVVMTLVSIGHAKEFLWSYLVLPILFFVLHIGYGIGTLVGIISRKSGNNI